MAEGKNELARRQDAGAPAPSSDRTLSLNQTETLDLSGLTDTQIAELRQSHAAGMIDIQRKAQELKVDVAALDATLGSLNQATSQATQAGSHITTTHTQTTSAGRTETIVGNTDRAASGKISRSAAGLSDNSRLIIIGVVVAVAILAFIAFGQ